MNWDPWDCSLRSDVFMPDSIACNTHNIVYALVHYIVSTLVKIVNAFLWYSGEVLLWGNQGAVLWLLCIWIALLYDSLKDFVPFSQPIRRKPQTNHVTCSHAFSRRTVTRGTHHLQDIIGSFECLLVSWLIRSIAKVLLLRCSFENSHNNWSLHYSRRFIGSDQPDAHRINTRSLWPWSDRPHSIVSAVCGDKNVYYKWLHDWGTRHTWKAHPYRGKRLWYPWRFKATRCLVSNSLSRSRFLDVTQRSSKGRTLRDIQNTVSNNSSLINSVMFLGISSQNGKFFGFHQNGRLELVFTVVVIFLKSLYAFLKGDYHWAEFAGQTSLRSRRLEVVGERESGRGRHASPRVSPSRAPVFSCAHCFQAPATQAMARPVQ